MADRGDADLAQIVSGQLRQDLPIDPVLGESWRVLGQTEATQPFRSVHGLYLFVAFSLRGLA